MANDELCIAVLMTTLRIFRRNRELEEMHARRIRMYCLLLLQILQQDVPIRPYCRVIIGFRERVLGALLREERKPVKEHLRVNPESLPRLVQITERNRKRSGWCIKLEVIKFLFWLACVTSYRVVSATFDVPRTTVHRTVHKILRIIISILPTIVRLPPLHKLPEIGEAFARQANSNVFSQCVGAIDGCHVRIIFPDDLHDQYYNRKQFYSINLQGLVDDTGLFIDIVSGFPGSVHDNRVFRNSALFQQSLYPPDGYFIIGDSGYPCRRHPVSIITPFKEHLTPEKHAFNHAHSKARMVVERTFGMMKVRWRAIFTKALEVKIETAIKVIAACTVMHNVCLTQGDVIHVDNNFEELPPRRIPRDERHGNDFRNLCLHMFTLEQLQQHL